MIHRLREGYFQQAPRAFRIEKMELQDDGSLRLREAHRRSTRKAVELASCSRLTTENGLFKINDVIYLRDKST